MFGKGESKVLTDYGANLLKSCSFSSTTTIIDDDRI